MKQGFKWWWVSQSKGLGGTQTKFAVISEHIFKKKFAKNALSFENKEVQLEKSLKLG